MDLPPTSPDGSSETGTAWVERLRNAADVQAWGQFVERYSRRIRAWLLSKGYSVHDIDDVVQELALTIHRRIQAYVRARAPFRRWLYVVTIHLAKDLAAKEHAEQEKKVRYDAVTPKVVDGSDAQELESVVDDEVLRQLVRDALWDLLSREQISKRDYEIFVHLLTARDPRAAWRSLSAKHGLKIATLYKVKSRVLKLLKLALAKLDSRGAGAV